MFNPSVERLLKWGRRFLRVPPPDSWAVRGSFELKIFLAACQFSCLLALLLSTPRRYVLTIAFLLAVIPATVAFRASDAWLHAWYPVLVGPVALLRFAAGLEIAHRQTEGFRHWSRLMGSVFLLAGMFAALLWVRSAFPDFLREVVELRRLLQIFSGAVFLVLESFWISQGGGFYRRADRIAAAWSLMALTHGGVSILAGVGQFRGLSAWVEAAGAVWLIDGVCFVGLTGLFLGGSRFAQRGLKLSGTLRDGLHSRVSSR